MKDKDSNFPGEKLYISISIFIMGYLLLRLAERIIWSRNELLSRVDSWCITEFLVNYQGGYVRRGLFGELLYQLTNIFPAVDPRWYIGIVCFFSVIGVVWFLVKKIKKENLCWWILPLNVCLMGAYDLIRKDFICTLFVMCTLHAYNKINTPRLRCITVSSLLVIALNIHECVFFMCVPFIALLYIKDMSMNLSYKIIGIIIPLVAMCLICYYKGNQETAQHIWQSWSNIYDNYKTSSPSGSIAAIGWDSSYAISYHTQVNFFSRSGIVYGWYSKPLVWIAILYVIPHILFIKRKLNHNTSSDITRFIAIMVFQFCSLIPMFTILSCDGSRICFYWLVSTFLIYFIINPAKTSQIWPTIYTNAISTLQNKLFNPKSTKIAIVMLLFLAISQNYTDLVGAFYNSIIGTYIYSLSLLSEYLLSFSA